MKLTHRTHELLFELSRYVNEGQRSLLISDESLLRKNLLALYRMTGDVRVHDLVIKIMAEGGYPWFGKLALSANRVVSKSRSAESPLFDSEFQLSDDKFMDLMPANEHFH